MSFFSETGEKQPSEHWSKENGAGTLWKLVVGMGPWLYDCTWKSELASTVAYVLTNRMFDVLLVTYYDIGNPMSVACAEVNQHIC